MTFSSADPISSGRPYPVLEVGGAAPSDLAQFVGDARFTIDRDGTPAEVCGQGSANEPGVLFWEKAVDHDGKDVRTWQISRWGGAFVAESMPRF
jgi:hypothetical protein